MWSRGQSAIRHFGWILFIISHHPAKLVAKGVVQEKIFRFYFCHVIWRDWVVRESRDIISDFTLSEVTTLQSFVIIDLLEEEI